MSVLKKEKKELEEEVSDLEKDVKKLKRKPKAQQAVDRAIVIATRPSVV